jgi:hypothetical protein
LEPPGREAGGLIQRQGRSRQQFCQRSGVQTSNESFWSQPNDRKEKLLDACSRTFRNFACANSSHFDAMNLVPLLKCAPGVALLLLAGCETRSISNSGYPGGNRYAASTFRGELSEFDVLGVAISDSISDADIATALKDTDRPRLRRDSNILLIQSGADLPDDPMMTAMAERYRVTAFSGQPVSPPNYLQPAKVNTPSMARALRLAAARGGYDKIVCYWGVLESLEKNQVTSAVSWIPIVGYVLPDREQQMRIRLKAVIVDVASGRWTFVTPPPASSSDFASRMTRAQTDQELVLKLKESGYRNLVQTLVAGEAG